MDRSPIEQMEKPKKKIYSKRNAITKRLIRDLIMNSERVRTTVK